jgi:hypothetical protein
MPHTVECNDEGQSATDGSCHGKRRHERVMRVQVHNVTIAISDRSKHRRGEQIVAVARPRRNARDSYAFQDLLSRK